MRRLSSLIKRRDGRPSETGPASDMRSPTDSRDPYTRSSSASAREGSHSNPFHAPSSSNTAGRTAQSDRLQANAFPAASPPPYQPVAFHEEPQSMSPTSPSRTNIPTAARSRLSSDVHEDQQAEYVSSLIIQALVPSSDSTSFRNPLRALARYDVVYLIDE
jgi:hypothetical protein